MEAWRRFDMADFYNPEKYPDPTAYKALKNIEKQERRKKRRFSFRSSDAKAVS